MRMLITKVKMKVGKFLGKIRCFQKDFFSQGSKALHIQRHKKMQR